jgi:hypothetical protein
VRLSILFILLGLFIPAIGGAMCTSPCRTEQQITDKPSRTGGGYDKPDGTHVVIPQFKGAMKGAKPTVYQPRHPKHPTVAAPFTSSVHP